MFAGEGLDQRCGEEKLGHNRERFGPVAGEASVTRTSVSEIPGKGIPHYYNAFTAKLTTCSAFWFWKQKEPEPLGEDPSLCQVSLSSRLREGDE